MISRKLDGIQILLLIVVFIFFYTSIVLPYEMAADGSFYRGSKNIIRWGLFIYTAWLGKHLWGSEIYSLDKHIAVLSVLFFLFSYLQIFFTDEGGRFLWGNFFFHMFAYLACIGVLLLDRVLYRTGRRGSNNVLHK